MRGAAVIRVTIACPEALIGDANQLASCLGLGPEDAQTYGAACWRDIAGNRYAVASAMVGESFLSASAAALRPPAWPTDMAAAARAQVRVTLGLPATPERLAAMVSASPEAALSALGLTRLPESPA